MLTIRGGTARWKEREPANGPGFGSIGEVTVENEVDEMGKKIKTQPAS